MQIKSGQSIAFVFCTADPSSGSGLDPTGLATTTVGNLYINKVKDTVTAITFTDDSTNLGVTGVSYTVPSGLSEGTTVQCVINATVGGITAPNVVRDDQVVAAFPGEIYARLGAPAGVSIAADVALRKPFDYPIASSPITYNANGDIQTVHFASGKIHTYSYNSSFKLLGITES